MSIPWAARPEYGYARSKGDHQCLQLSNSPPESARRRIKMVLRFDAVLSEDSTVPATIQRLSVLLLNDAGADLYTNRAARRTPGQGKIRMNRLKKKTLGKETHSW